MDRKFVDIVHVLLLPQPPGSPVARTKMETNFVTAVGTSDLAIRAHRQFLHENWKVNPIYHNLEIGVPWLGQPSIETQRTL